MYAATAEQHDHPAAVLLQVQAQAKLSPDDWLANSHKTPLAFRMQVQRMAVWPQGINPIICHWYLIAACPVAIRL